ncbi:metal-sensitive transcriptional regulator [Clostridium mediterraneense]|uniref:metal-sensitive transcriptional regulator n=1 Tax=Clostridium mediterraneense TaxID=1805472 RepID=UPI000A6F4042|nr:metal-sensitive transcriptional regulator [Clostridium mediterraneense]
MNGEKEQDLTQEEIEQEIAKKDILVRLRRIEGQVKGIQGMMEKNVCQKDVLTQISAIRSAINKVGILIVENYARNCMGINKEDENYEGLQELIKTLNSFIK